MYKSSIGKYGKTASGRGLSHSGYRAPAHTNMFPAPMPWEFVGPEHGRPCPDCGGVVKRTMLAGGNNPLICEACHYSSDGVDHKAKWEASAERGRLAEEQRRQAREEALRAK